MIVFVFSSVIAFAFMGIDKWLAQQDAYRIPERMLFMPALLGGAIGGTVGMFLFHHKTKHWYFRYGFPLLAVLQVLLIAWRFS